MESKTCTGCNKNREFSEFTKSKLGKFGLRAVCKVCRALASIEYRIKNKNQIAIYGKKYRLGNQNKISKQRAEHTIRKKKELHKYSTEYRKNNPGKVNAKTAKRRAKKRNATPKWLTKEHWVQIEQFYIESSRLSKDTGYPHEVDHVVPIQGRNVCGLHVPWNLQIITKSENRKKSYKF